MEMKFGVPTTVPTRGVDDLVAAGGTLEQMTALARDKEFKYERLKLFHDNVLTGLYEPYLPVVTDMTDKELERIIHEAGWTFVKDQFGTPEEWLMWTNRFRRLIAIIRTIR